MVDRVDEVFLKLKILNGIDEDLARAYTRLINQIRSALIGTYPEFERVLRGQVIHHKEIEDHVLALIQDIPHTEILPSMPGIGPKSAAQILMTVGDMSDSPSAAHVASYAGLSPRNKTRDTSCL